MNKPNCLLLIAILLLALATNPAAARPLASGSQTYVADSLLAWAGYTSAYTGSCSFYWDSGYHAIGFAFSPICYGIGTSDEGGRMALYTSTLQSWDYNATTITFEINYHPDSCNSFGAMLGKAWLVDGSLMPITTIPDSYSEPPFTVTWNNPGGGLSSFFLIIQNPCDSWTYLNQIVVSWSGAATATPGPTPTPYPTLAAWHFTLSDMVAPTLPALNEFAPGLVLIFGVILALGLLLWIAHFFRKEL